MAGLLSPAVLGFKIPRSVLFRILRFSRFGNRAAGWSAAKGGVDLRLPSERAAIGVWLLITACMLLLVHAFLTLDFSVTYVANNTNRGTPFCYWITALWGALEGTGDEWSMAGSPFLRRCVKPVKPR